MLKRLLLTAVGLILLIGCTQMLEQRASVIRLPEVAPGATYVGSEACYDCHDDYAEDRHNVHMRIASFEVPYQTGCEGCHGPGSLHIENDGDIGMILRFGPHEGMAPEEVAGVCTTCHQGGEQTHWATSEHAFYDVSCLECHKVHHNTNTSLVSKKGNQLCNTCHQDVWAKMHFVSHHPLKEGKMSCSDCHQPHGSSSIEGGMLRTEERVNDLCLSCHTRYQGPFVFEHDPVVEDCLNCHDPHGTVANNLLRQNEPFVCLQCHEGHFHALRASNNANAVNPAGAGTDKPFAGASGSIQPSDHGFQMSFMTKCTQCHSHVHGSDLPSQTSSGQGGALTR